MYFYDGVSVSHRLRFLIARLSDSKRGVCIWNNLITELSLSQIKTSNSLRLIVLFCFFTIIILLQVLDLRNLKMKMSFLTTKGTKNKSILYIRSYRILRVPFLQHLSRSKQWLKIKFTIALLMVFFKSLSFFANNESNKSAILLFWS